MSTASFHAEHSAKFAAVEPDACWFCGRERAKCKRKIWYANERDAQRAADDLTDLTQKPHGSYACPWCGGFHVTTHLREAS